MNVLSAGYGGVARLRRAWYARHPEARRRLDRPVISVGNLVVGGSGKTPATAALARVLRARGERPGILSRGYARREQADGVVVVSDGERVLEPVERAGDEPLMLARSLPGVPVLVSADRFLAGRLAERRLGCTVLLLDDGFQHLQLARDVDLLLVEAGDLDETVLPFGRLREPLASARSADAVVLNGTPAEAERVAARLGVARAFAATRHFEAFRAVGSGTPADVRGGARVVAVAGIARPERFFAALRTLGCEVVRAFAFADHHWYTARDMRRVGAAMRESDAELVVTTEKDAVRLCGFAGEAGAWVYLPMHVTIEPAGEFAAWLGEKV